MDAPAQKRILVVDDQPYITRIIQLNLSREGYAVIPCHDPVEVLERIDEWNPDLLIVDIRMPRMSGTELCQRLREQPRMHSVPIIILTGQGESETADRANEAGADAFMTKPFSPKAMAAKVRELLELYGRV